MALVKLDVWPILITYKSVGGTADSPRGGARVRAGLWCHWWCCIHQCARRSGLGCRAVVVGSRVRGLPHWWERLHQWHNCPGEAITRRRAGTGKEKMSAVGIGCVGRAAAGRSRWPGTGCIQPQPVEPVPRANGAAASVAGATRLGMTRATRQSIAKWKKEMEGEDDSGWLSSEQFKLKEKNEKTGARPGDLETWRRSPNVGLDK